MVTIKWVNSETMIVVRVNEPPGSTERITCILCMHLGACRFFTHPTALMHLKNILSNISKTPEFYFFAHTRIGSHWELL